MVVVVVTLGLRRRRLTVGVVQIAEGGGGGGNVRRLGDGGGGRSRRVGVHRRREDRRRVFVLVEGGTADAGVERVAAEVRRYGRGERRRCRSVIDRPRVLLERKKEVVESWFKMRDRKV